MLVSITRVYETSKKCIITETTFLRLFGANDRNLYQIVSPGAPANLSIAVISYDKESYGR